MRHAKAIAVLLAPLALVACSGGEDAQNNVDALDNELAGNGADPALMGALQDQIMVDPQLAQQSNKDAIRPPSQPYSAALPAETVAAGKTAMPKDGELMKAPAPTQASGAAFTAQEQAVTLGGLAARQKNPRTASCAAKLAYSASWAARMPAGLPLHPQARVVEAAGAQADGCTLRAVTFSTPQPLQTMIDWYYTRAMKAGFKAEHQLKDGTHLLGGTRPRDGNAFIIFLSARADGGTDIDLLAEGGR